VRRRVDALLTFRRARTYALIVVAVYIVAWCYEVGVLSSVASPFSPEFAKGFPIGAPPLNSSGAPISGDYIAFHTAGRLLLLGRGSEIYDRPAVMQIQASLLDGRAPGFYDAFRNPPFAALPFVVTAELDLLAGFALWTLLSLVCLGLSLWLLLDETPWLRVRWRGLAVLGLGFAPVYFGIIDGENATISLLLYVLIYRALVRDQPWQAGVWAALGLFKPQLFVLFPLVFLARGSWRAVLSYALTVGVLAVVSVGLVGPDGVRAWFQILLEPESGNALANAWRMASLKSFFDLALPGQALVSLGLYGVASLGLVALLLGAWARAAASLPVLWAFTSLVAVLVDPHLVDYDLSVLVPAGVLAAVLLPSLRWWMVLLYVLVIFRVQVPTGWGAIQFTVLVLAWCAYLVLRAMRRESLEASLAGVPWPSPVSSRLSL